MIQTNLFDQQYQDQLAIIDPHYVPVMSSATWSYLGPLITHLQPHRILEIGTAIGFGTLLMARIVSQRGGQVTTFEISYPRYHQALHHFHTYGSQYLSSISAYHMDFNRLTHDRFVDTLIDFARIDGQKAQYPLYIDMIIPRMKSGGICVLDDMIDYPQYYNLIKQFAYTHGCSHKLIQLSDGDGIVILIKL